MWGRASALHDRCSVTRSREPYAPSDRPRTQLPQGPRPPARADRHVGHDGLTDAVLKEIDGALTAHELIKVRVNAGDRTARRALFEEICARTGAEAVQQVGKVLVLWRPRPLDAA